MGGYRKISCRADRERAKAKDNAYSREYRRLQIERGICEVCGSAFAEPGKKRCADCRLYDRQRRSGDTVFPGRISDKQWAQIMRVAAQNKKRCKHQPRVNGRWVKAEDSHVRDRSMPV